MLNNPGSTTVDLERQENSGFCCLHGKAYHRVSFLISIWHWSALTVLLLFSRSVVTNSLWLHGLQHARLPCPLPPLGACSNSCPLSWWCHPTILSSVISFSSCLQSPCTPRDSQESSPTPQFKSISSSSLSILYGPELTSIHDCRKNHSFDYTDLFQQCDISAF